VNAWKLMFYLRLFTVCSPLSLALEQQQSRHQLYRRRGTSNVIIEERGQLAFQEIQVYRLSNHAQRILLV
jgi:hypothetical protein